jgi:serine phosphatase RsbU (regulator of sigma subunit)/pSer/pThr/pTyr-binding forkhead associated (FHA) protein
MAYLTYKGPDGRSERLELEPRRYTLGRSSKNDVTLPDLSLSRRHAELRPSGDGGWLVVDLQSKNGTFLNNAQVTSPTPLSEGDRVVLGDTEFLFGPDTGSRVSLVEEPVASLASDATVVLPVESIATREGQVQAAAAPDLSAGGDIVFRANRELVQHRPLPELLERILDLALESSRAQRGFLMLHEGDPPKLVTRGTRGGKPGEDFVLSRTLARMVVEEQQSVLTSDVLQDDRFAAGQSILAQGIRSLMCVPLYNDKNVIGLLYVDSQSGISPFAEADLRVLTTLANVAAIKIENTRLIERQMRAAAMERDLQEAARVQRSFLPEEIPLQLPGLAVAGMTLPCREVGGDYYDVLQRPQGHYLLAVADVSGKGLPAALMMSNFQAALRARADGQDSLGALVAGLNDQLARSYLTNKFVTFFVAEYAPEISALRFSNAGHNPPLLARRSGELERLAVGGLPLGLFAGTGYEVGTCQLDPGDLLIIYSDGVTESINDEEEEFGEERLEEIVSGSLGEPPRAVLDRIDEAVGRFAGSQARPDDLTLVVARREDLP